MKRLTKLGITLTGGWVLALAIITIFRVNDAGAMTLNEWGDFLAGASAPLALFWLVIGYFQHGEELRLNTKALKTQQEELRRQVEETARLVDAAREEVRFLQRRERREARPDLVSTGGGGNNREGIYVSLQNRGAEARAIRISYEGPYNLTFSPKEILESNATGALNLSHKRNELPAFPIRFSIICADLIGCSHTIEFELLDGYEIRKLSHRWEDLAEKYEA